MFRLILPYHPCWAYAVKSAQRLLARRFFSLHSLASHAFGFGAEIGEIGSGVGFKNASAHLC